MAKNADNQPATATAEDVKQAVAMVDNDQTTAVEFGFTELSLPDLGTQVLIPIDLVSSYWSPEKIGESRNLFFDRVAVQSIPDVYGPDPEVMKDVPYVFFFERDENGHAQVVCAGAARLVGFFQDRQFPRLAPFQITYKGKVQNKSNNFESQSFEIKMFAVKTENNG